MLVKKNQQKIAIALTTLLLIISFNAFTQDSLSLDDVPTEKVFVKEAFNGTRLVISHTTNIAQKKTLALLFGHRFGKIEEGAFNAFGLDQAFIRIGFEYSITDWILVGGGRSSFGKTFDTYLKGKPLTQGGPKNIPVSAVIVLNGAVSAHELRRQNEIHGDGQFMNQLVYAVQSSISRQFSYRFSFQLTGSMVHRNTVIDDTYSNNVYGFGGGARLKLNDRIHLVGEYSQTFSNPDNIKNPFAAGIDIVAGGHLFTLFVANGVGLIEQSAYTENTDYDLRLGFTIKRDFHLGKSKVEGGKVKY